MYNKPNNIKPQEYKIYLQMSQFRRLNVITSEYEIRR